MASKPVSLAPISRIIEVGWSAGRGVIVAIYYKVQTLAHTEISSMPPPEITPTVTLNLPLGDTANLVEAPFLVVDGYDDTLPPIEEIVSPLMRRAYKMWSYPVHKVTTTDSHEIIGMWHITPVDPGITFPDMPPDPGAWDSLGAAQAALAEWRSHAGPYAGEDFIIERGNDQFFASTTAKFSLLSFIQVRPYLVGGSEVISFTLKCSAGTDANTRYELYIGSMKGDLEATDENVPEFEPEDNQYYHGPTFFPDTNDVDVPADIVHRFTVNRITGLLTHTTD